MNAQLLSIAAVNKAQRMHKWPCYYFMCWGIVCTAQPCVHVVVVVVTESAGVSGQHRGGRRDLGHRGLQVWECSKQAGAEEAEFTGCCRRMPGWHVTDFQLCESIMQADQGCMTDSGRGKKPNITRLLLYISLKPYIWSSIKNTYYFKEKCF